MVKDLAARLHSVQAYELENNSFIASLVDHIVRTARPTGKQERELMASLRDLNRGFVMLRDGGRIVQEQAFACRKVLPR